MRKLSEIKKVCLGYEKNGKGYISYVFCDGKRYFGSYKMANKMDGEILTASKTYHDFAVLGGGYRDEEVLDYDNISESPIIDYAKRVGHSKVTVYREECISANGEKYFNTDILMSYDLNRANKVKPKILSRV